MSSTLSSTQLNKHESTSCLPALSCLAFNVAAHQRLLSTVVPLCAARACRHAAVHGRNALLHRRHLLQQPRRCSHLRGESPGRVLMSAWCREWQQRGCLAAHWQPSTGGREWRCGARGAAAGCCRVYQPILLAASHFTLAFPPLWPLQAVVYEEQCVGSATDGAPCQWTQFVYNFDK